MYNTNMKNKVYVILTGFIVKCVVTDSVTDSVSDNIKPDSYSLSPVSF
jgi:hypothetical protein